MFFLLCHFVYFFIIFFVYTIYFEVTFSNLQMYFIFFLCTYPKADDTYIQLKKDLEYLDLKVSFHKSLLPLFYNLAVFVCHLYTYRFWNNFSFRDWNSVSFAIAVLKIVCAYSSSYRADMETEKNVDTLISS